MYPMLRTTVWAFLIIPFPEFWTSLHNYKYYLKSKHLTTLYFCHIYFLPYLICTLRKIKSIIFCRVMVWGLVQVYWQQEIKCCSNIKIYKGITSRTIFHLIIKLQEGTDLTLTTATLIQNFFWCISKNVLLLSPSFSHDNMVTSKSVQTCLWSTLQQFYFRVTSDRQDSGTDAVGSNRTNYIEHEHC